MKVSVDISAEYKEPYAVIYTDKVTDEIQRMIDIFSTSETPITALQNEEDLIVLQPKEIFMVRVEDGDTIIYGEKNKYRSRKRLYEIGQQLGKQFMQISKTTLINLSYMDSIEIQRNTFIKAEEWLQGLCVEEIFAGVKKISRIIGGGSNERNSERSVKKYGYQHRDGHDDILPVRRGI